MKNLKLHTPTGLNDLLPSTFRRKRNLVRRIEAVFEGYGYAFVSSPTLEYLAVFEGIGSIPVTEIYKLGDRNGDMLALRSDMTPAVARMAATHNLMKSSPLRLCYIEKAFRNHERFQGRENEFTQAGAELMGISSPEADAELIALAVHGLIAAGLVNFRVDIGEVNFLPGVLSELETALSEAERRAFIHHMIKRDYVSAEKLAAKAKHIIPAGELLSDLTQLAGGLEMLNRALSMLSNPQSQKALRHLKSVYEILQDQNLARHILLDLSMTGQLDYYTGVIFKGYAKGSGTTVVDGGRYDQMISIDAKPVPAVGFGTKIDGVLDALTAQDISFDEKPADTLLAYHPSARAVALTVGDSMRKNGTFLENSLITGDLEDHKTYAKSRNLKGILYFADPDTVLLVNLETGHVQKTTVNELLG